MTTDQDDFTFPTFSSAVDSPRLWSLSPATSPDSPHCTKLSSKNAQEEEEEDSNKNSEEEQVEEYKIDSFRIHTEVENYTARRKSCSWIERGHISRLRSEFEEEENMDMLWEDCNEELSSLKRRTSEKNMGCVKVEAGNLRLSKKGKRKAASGSGFVMFVKVLKKLFVMHHSNTHCSLRSSTRSPKHLPW